MMLFQFSQVRNFYAKLMESLQQGPRRYHPINWELIKINQLPFVASELDSLPKNGYFTLTGPNGSGKTTALLALKQTLGDKAFYLPASTDELLLSRPHLNKSSGQRAKLILGEILLSKDFNIFEVLLLDEWDANLDKETKTELLEMIREVSKQKLIVDVRH
jgi:ABC-type Mn2+/Zn2+ transport system ATPase subunit